METISVGVEELLEWLVDWGSVKEGDKILNVRLCYGTVEFEVGSEED